MLENMSAHLASSLKYGMAQLSKIILPTLGLQFQPSDPPGAANNQTKNRLNCSNPIIPANPYMKSYTFSTADKELVSPTYPS